MVAVTDIFKYLQVMHARSSKNSAIHLDRTGLMKLRIKLS